MRTRLLYAGIIIPTLAIGGVAASSPSEGTADSVAGDVTSGESSRHIPAVKGSYTSRPAPGERVIEVKLAHGSSLRLDGERVSGEHSDLDTVNAVLTGATVEAVAPLIPAVTDDVRSHVEAADADPSSPNLSQWLAVTVAPGQDAEKVAEQLNGSAAVEIAYARPRAVQAPSAMTQHHVAASQIAADLENNQGYLFGPDKLGVNAKYAHQIAGGKGGNVNILDIEGGWQLDHPDMPTLNNNSVATQGTPQSEYEYHGTSVMGEVIAADNGDGVTGIVPQATPYVVHVNTQEQGFNSAFAVSTAASKLGKGDVMIVELQTDGCTGSGGRGGYVAQEWIPSVFDAVKAATNKGIHVLEAAGNGSENLDAGCYGESFPADRGDSGAIIVGAGPGMKPNGDMSSCGGAGRRQMFSTYGTRVTSNAWGLCVTTTAVGSRYTDAFSGTSSATPIVAGAVAAISSIAEERGVEVTPRQMRELIAKTGTNNAPRQMIGTLPNIKAALESLGNMPSPTTTTPAPTTSTPAPTTTFPSPTTTSSTTTTAAPTTTSPTFECDDDQRFTYTDRVTAAGTTIVPNGRYYRANDGRHSFCLTGNTGTSFDMTLQVWNDRWEDVASSSAPGTQDKLIYEGRSGYYRLVVNATTNTGGDFTLKYVVPTGRN